MVRHKSFFFCKRKILNSIRIQLVVCNSNCFCFIFCVTQIVELLKVKWSELITHKTLVELINFQAIYQLFIVGKLINLFN